MATNAWDPERLLADGHFVRSLSRDLVAGAADVDDLVQETWLRALSRPRRAGFSPRAWLAGLVRNVARETRRSDWRRERRDQAALPTSARDEDPALLAQRFDLLRQVLAWIGEMPEPTRQALLLRYLEELEPAAIAQRLAVPDATIRSRIKRGLDELRARLDRAAAERAGDRASWMGALVPWSAPALVETTMTVKAGAAAGVALLLITAGLLVRAWWGSEAKNAQRPARAAMTNVEDKRLPTPAIAAAVDVDPVSRTEERVASDAGEVEAASADLLPTSQNASGWRIEGVLRGVDPAIPWAGTITATSVAVERRDAPRLEPLKFKSDVPPAPDGRFTLELPESAPEAGGLGRWRGLQLVVADPSYVDVGAFIDALDERGAPRAGPWIFHVELETRRSARVHGRVIDEDGRPLAGIHVSWEEWNPHDDERVTTTDAHGQYRLEAAELGTVELRAQVEHPYREDTAAIGASALKDLLATSTTVDLRPGVDTAVPDLVLRRGAAITGIVVDGDASPIAGTIVRGSCRRPAPDARSPDREVWFVRDAFGRDDGTFTLSGLVAGTWNLRVLGVQDVPCHPVVANDDDFGAVNAEAPSNDVEVVFRLCRVELRAQLDGQPVAQCKLSVQGTSRDGRESSTLGGQTDADGRFRFLALPGCEYQARIHHPEAEEATPPFALEEDASERVVTLDLEPRRPRPSLSVRLVDPSGARVGRAWFQLRPIARPDDPWREFGGMAPEGDAFLLKDLELGSYQLLVRAGGGNYGSGGSFQEETVDVELSEPRCVERRIKLRSTGRLRVFAHDAEGRGVRTTCVVRSLDGIRLNASFTYESEHGASSSPAHTHDEQPSFVTPPPAPGRYLLSFSADGFAPKSVEADVVTGETTDVVVELLRH